jgi:hypothetical protein
MIVSYTESRTKIEPIRQGFLPQCECVASSRSHNRCESCHNVVTCTNVSNSANSLKNVGCNKLRYFSMIILSEKRSPFDLWTGEKLYYLAVDSM